MSTFTISSYSTWVLILKSPRVMEQNLPFPPSLRSITTSFASMINCTDRAVSSSTFISSTTSISTFFRSSRSANKPAATSTGLSVEERISSSTKISSIVISPFSMCLQRALHTSVFTNSPALFVGMGSIDTVLKNAGSDTSSFSLLDVNTNRQRKAG